MIIKKKQQYTMMGNNFEDKGRSSLEKTTVVLKLLTPAQFEKVPDGTELVSIFGERKIKGKDECHPDELRGGFMSVGFIEDSKVPDGLDLTESLPQTIEYPPTK